MTVTPCDILLSVGQREIRVWRLFFYDILLKYYLRSMAFWADGGYGEDVTDIFHADKS